MSLGLPVVATTTAERGVPRRRAACSCRPATPSALAEGIRTALDDARRPALARRARQWVADEHDRSQTLPAQYRAVMQGEV